MPVTGGERRKLLYEKYSNGMRSTGRDEGAKMEAFLSAINDTYAIL